MAPGGVWTVSLGGTWRGRWVGRDHLEGGHLQVGPVVPAPAGQHQVPGVRQAARDRTIGGWHLLRGLSSRLCQICKNKVLSRGPMVLGCIKTFKNKKTKK